MQFQVERNGHESRHEAVLVNDSLTLSNAEQNDKQLTKCTYIKRPAGTFASNREVGTWESCMFSLTSIPTYTFFQSFCKGVICILHFTRPRTEDFKGYKNQQHSFLGRRSKAVGTMS
jgi:hypothetical protein